MVPKFEIETRLGRTRRRQEALFQHALALASELFGVHERDIAGPYKFSFCIPPRFAIYAALHACGISTTRVGAMVNRHRKSVVNGLDRHDYMMERVPDYAAKATRIAEAVKQMHEGQTHD